MCLCLDWPRAPALVFTAKLVLVSCAWSGRVFVARVVSWPAGLVCASGASPSQTVPAQPARLTGAPRRPLRRRGAEACPDTPGPDDRQWRTASARHAGLVGPGYHCATISPDHSVDPRLLRAGAGVWVGRCLPIQLLRPPPRPRRAHDQISRHTRWTFHSDIAVQCCFFLLTCRDRRSLVGWIMARAVRNLRSEEARDRTGAGAR